MNLCEDHSYLGDREYAPCGICTILDELKLLSDRIDKLLERIKFLEQHSFGDPKDE
jgi:hypothetical protein